MKIITLCGSTRFEEYYRAINAKFTLEGNVVLSCGVFNYKNPDKEDKRDLLQEVHRQKIDMADEVFVINVDGYIGEHTQEEIDYCKTIGKPVKYLVSKLQMKG